MPGYRPLAALCLAAIVPQVDAKVLDQGAGGFTVRHEATVQAPRAEVWMQVLRIGQWWQSDHTYSGDSANLNLQAHPGGCFCESLAGGGAVEHMRVLAVMPPTMLRLGGGLGPLQELAVTGALTIALEEAEGATRVVMTYRVGGYLAAGLNTWSEPVDQVLGAQVQALAARFASKDAAAK